MPPSHKAVKRRSYDAACALESTHMNAALVVKKAPATAPGSATPPELMLMFHGVGAHPEDLVPLGRALAAQRPHAHVVSVGSPEPSDMGVGWQWFPIRGITEATRQARVDAAMPAFLQTISQWQQDTGISPEQTTLIGFSQGAIMALEATQQAVSPAARVIAIAGRFAQAPRQAPLGMQVNLMHGDEDGVMPVALAESAFAQLQALGAKVTLDRFPGLGHGIDGRVVERMHQRLGNGL